MKRVYSTRNPTDAHLLADVLEAEGIPAATRNTNFGWRSATPLLDASSVWVVEDADFERAMKIVEEFTQGEGFEPGETWQCTACGEHIDAHFDACWKCAATEGDPSHAPTTEIRSTIFARLPWRGLALVLGAPALLVGLVGIYDVMHAPEPLLSDGVLVRVPGLIAVGVVLLILGTRALRADTPPLLKGLIAVGVSLLGICQLMLSGTTDILLEFVALALGLVGFFLAVIGLAALLATRLRP